MSKILDNCLRVFEKYLTDESNNEIIISHEKVVWLDKGNRFEEVKDEAMTIEFLKAFIIELVNQRGELFNKKNPTLSTSIPNTLYRVKAVHNSVLAEQDIQLNIRIPSKEVLELEAWEIDKKLDLTYDKLRELAKGHYNILISGATGSGKTGLSKAMMKYISESERVITIEDSPELIFHGRNKTRLLASKTGKGYTYINAIDDAMRLLPQRLILGEIDVANTLPFLNINNTGHKGNMTTIHANSARDCFNRIKTNMMLSGFEVSNDSSINSYIAGSLDYVMHIRRDITTNKRIITDFLNVQEYFNKEI